VGYHVGSELVRKNWSGGLTKSQSLFRPELLTQSETVVWLDGKKYRTQSLIPRRAKIAQMPISPFLAVGLDIPIEGIGV
jgi:hypothetical protein